MYDRDQRMAAERFAERNPTKCICEPFAAYHSLACRNQDWSKNLD